MVKPWNPDATGPGYVYVHVADHLAARIADGEIAVGEQLVGERELAAEYTVALGTARRAVQILRERGLVQTWPGKGTYVTATPEQTEQA